MSLCSIESFYVINFRDLEMKHVKDFVFVHGDCHWLIFLTSFIMVHGYSGDSMHVYNAFYWTRLSKTSCL